jgi:hypothetical protein
MSTTARLGRRAGMGLVGLALLASGCNKVHLYAKQMSSGQGAILEARQPAMFEKLYWTSLPFELPADGRLVITFSTMGTVQPMSGIADMPPVVLQCRIDNTPCVALDDASVQFRFPAESPQGVWSYDTRAYTWVVSNAAKGSHTVEMWGMFGFPTLAKLVTLTDWSLVVQAFDN